MKTKYKSQVLTYNNENINISFNKSRALKYIKVKPDFINYGAIVTLPNDKSYKEALLFVQKNISWLVDKLKKYKPTYILHQNKLTLFDNNYNLLYEYHNKKYPSIKIEGTNIVIYDQNINGINHNKIQSLCYEDLETINRYLIVFLKNLALGFFQDRVKIACTDLDLTYNKVKIQDAKGRWGSCSSLGDLSFNWRLIFAPLFVTNYIIYHELAHLIHFNHSSDFWTLVNKWCKETNEAKLWLKNNGQNLHLYS